MQQVPAYISFDTTVDGSTSAPSIELTVSGTQKIVTTDGSGNAGVAGWYNHRPNSLLKRSRCSF